MHQNNNLKKYYEIMSKYYQGEFGDKDLTVSEILERAECPNLFDDMSLEEIQILIGKSTGFTRMVFSKIKTKKQKRLHVCTK